MVDVTSVDGQHAEIRDESITVITGPYPWEASAQLSYIRGSFAPSAFVCNEPAPHLISRLKLEKPLVQLMRPNSTPVWVKASAVSTIRYPLDTELPDPGSDTVVKCVIIVGGFHQALRQSVAEVHDLLLGGGLNVALLEGDHGHRRVSYR
jgi:hypothetical protein